MTRCVPRKGRWVVWRTPLHVHHSDECSAEVNTLLQLCMGLFSCATCCCGRFVPICLLASCVMLGGVLLASCVMLGGVRSYLNAALPAYFLQRCTPHTHSTCPSTTQQVTAREMRGAAMRRKAFGWRFRFAWWCVVLLMRYLGIVWGQGYPREQVGAVLAPSVSEGRPG